MVAILLVWMSKRQYLHSPPTICKATRYLRCVGSDPDPSARPPATSSSSDREKDEEGVDKAEPELFPFESECATDDNDDSATEIACDFGYLSIDEGDDDGHWANCPVESLDEGPSISIPDEPAETDDLTGPLHAESFAELQALERETSVFDEQEQGELDLDLGQLELTDTQQSRDLDAETTLGLEAEFELDDVGVEDAAQQWLEHPLPLACSSCCWFSLSANALGVAGERTHCLHPTTLVPLGEVPLAIPTKQIAALDSDGCCFVVLSLTGQLHVWIRRGTDSVVRKIRGAGRDDRIVEFWQASAKTPSLWGRTDQGNLVRLQGWETDELTLLSVPHTYPILAMSRLGEPRLALIRTPRGILLEICCGDARHTEALPSSLLEDFVPEAALLAGFGDTLLVGVRGHGLWLKRSEPVAFQRVCGLREISALAVGHWNQRPTGFAALFSELEDRTDLCMIDLVSARATRIARLSVVCDSAGPTDDPPERARVDGMLWDPSHCRLWVAGGFGITSFTPPTRLTQG